MNKGNEWVLVRDDIIPKTQKEVLEEITLFLQDKEFSYQLTNFYNLILSSYE